MTTATAFAGSQPGVALYSVHFHGRDDDSVRRRWASSSLTWSVGAGGGKAVESESILREASSCWGGKKKLGTTMGSGLLMVVKGHKQLEIFPPARHASSLISITSIVFFFPSSQLVLPGNSLLKWFPLLGRPSPLPTNHSLCFLYGSVQMPPPPGGFLLILAHSDPFFLAV